jgi:hypothetical protein
LDLVVGTFQQRAVRRRTTIMLVILGPHLPGAGTVCEWLGEGRRDHACDSRRLGDASNLPHRTEHRRTGIRNVGITIPPNALYRRLRAAEGDGAAAGRPDPGIAEDAGPGPRLIDVGKMPSRSSECWKRAP